MPQARAPGLPMTVQLPHAHLAAAKNQELDPCLGVRPPRHWDPQSSCISSGAMGAGLLGFMFAVFRRALAEHSCPL